MIRSMTGYGIAEKMNHKFNIKVEIKSLNGKFLELNLRAPKILGEKEVVLRKLLSQKLVRGSVLCIVTMEAIDVSDSMKLNKPLAIHYFSQIKSLADELKTNDGDALRTVLLLPDVMKSEDGTLDDSDWDDLVLTMEQAFDRFDDFRLTEGKEIAEVLNEYNNNIINLLPKIEPLEAERIEQVKSKLISNLEEIKSNTAFDQNRFEQELIYYLEKIDIAEEKSRLMAHCQHFANALKKEPSGKKLGFISQEMGREINTLGSKANFAPIQEIVIVMKEELEKIKEQSLNIL
ncbi:MAG: YicC family protein [Flavobacteriales bacterium]|nr:YicC family protein [Flavobacteriales bacterium]